MSYRTYINGNEWLGNNEGPQVILDELKKQGCPFSEDYCTWDKEKEEVVEFEIKDLDALVKATEQAILDLLKYRPEMADFNDSIEFWNKAGNLTYGLTELRENAYIFWSSRLLDFVGKDNYTKSRKKIKNGDYVMVYKLKPGVKCMFKAY